MKKVIVLFLVVLILVLPVSAASYSSYSGSSNNLSSTYVDYLRERISDIDPDEDYILFRSGQYSYILAVSEMFTYSGTTLSGKAELLTLSAHQSGSVGSSYNDYHVSVTEDNNFRYTNNGYMIYSNCIPGVPSFSEYQSVNYQTIIIVSLVAVVILLFFIGLKRGKRNSMNV